MDDKDKLLYLICKIYDLKPSLAIDVVNIIDTMAKDLSKHGAITRDVEVTGQPC